MLVEAKKAGGQVYMGGVLINKVNNRIKASSQPSRVEETASQPGFI